MDSFKLYTSPYDLDEYLESEFETTLRGYLRNTDSSSDLQEDVPSDLMALVSKQLPQEIIELDISKLAGTMKESVVSTTDTNRYIVVSVPASGHLHLLSHPPHDNPTTRNFKLVTGGRPYRLDGVRSGRIEFSLSLNDRAPEEINTEKAEATAELVSLVAATNDGVEAFRQTVPSRIGEQVVARRNELKQREEFLSGLDFPVQ